MKITGKSLVERYKLCARSAHYHVSGSWYWTLEKFPGVYFDANGYLLFLTRQDYFECGYLRIGPVNTGVRNKEAGISGIPGYVKLDPTPGSLRQPNCSHCGATKLLLEPYIPIGAD